jgi:hypothetical protein
MVALRIVKLRDAERFFYFYPNAFPVYDVVMIYMTRTGEYSEIYLIDSKKSRAAINSLEVGFRMQRFRRRWYCVFPLDFMVKKGLAKTLEYEEYMKLLADASIEPDIDDGLGRRR